jgi:thiamine biosynthesis protein ThiS
MLIVVNGQMHSLVEPHTLAALLRSVAPTPPFAVARNNEFISCRAYEECLLAEGDKIEIVHPTVGG